MTEQLASPIFDTHAHVLARKVPRFGGTASYVLYDDYSADRYIAELEENGIRYGVLAASSQVGTYNDYQIKALRAHDRLRGTAIIDVQSDLYTFEQLQSDGIVGVRLALRNQKLPDLTSIEYRRFLYRVHDHDWHVELHIDADRFPIVAGPLADAGVKLVVDHFGRPDVRKGPNAPGFACLISALDNGHTWVKLSAPYRLNGDPRPFVDALLQASGPERLLWGSDWPFTGGFEKSYSYRQALQDFVRLVPDAGQRKIIGSETPRALFGFAPDTE